MRNQKMGRPRLALTAFVSVALVASALMSSAAASAEQPATTPVAASTQLAASVEYPSPPVDVDPLVLADSSRLIIIQKIFVMDPNCFRNWDPNCYVTWTVRFTRVVAEHGWINAAAIFAVPGWTKVLIGLAVSKINSTADSAIYGRNPDGCVQFKYLKVPFMQARSVTHKPQSDKYCII